MNKFLCAFECPKDEEDQFQKRLALTVTVKVSGLDPRHSSSLKERKSASNVFASVALGRFDKMKNLKRNLAITKAISPRLGDAT